MATTDKLNYLNETKNLIKGKLNSLGANITDNDTFRSYVEAIDDIHVSKNIFNATEFLAGDYWNRQYFQKGNDENTLIVNNANTQQWTEMSLVFTDKIINGHTYYFSCEGASSIQINSVDDINISGTTATFKANTSGIKIKIMASSYPATITKLLLVDTTYEPYAG